MYGLISGGGLKPGCGFKMGFYGNLLKPGIFTPSIENYKHFLMAKTVELPFSKVLMREKHSCGPEIKLFSNIFHRVSKISHHFRRF